MSKSPDAFRTISEVAEFLETPAHVLRFWESRFPQIRPVKRAGGRRYYRPSDVALLTGIKRLLHEEGMTIRGVQKILREQGVRHVSGVADDSDDVTEDDDLSAALAKATGTPDPVDALPPAEAETAQIIALQAALRTPAAPPPTPERQARDEDGADESVPVDWQTDPVPEDDVADTQPEDTAAKVVEPPAPVIALHPTPVVADLFARVTPAEPPPPKPAEPVAEAPMAVWADEAAADADAPGTDPAPETQTPVLKITRIGPAAVPHAAEIASPAPAVAVVLPPVDPVVTGPTLAQRLRRVSVDALDATDRQRLSQIRDQAVALRARLVGPARLPG